MATMRAFYRHINILAMNMVFGTGNGLNEFAEHNVDKYYNFYSITCKYYKESFVLRKKKTIVWSNSFQFGRDYTTISET